MSVLNTSYFHDEPAAFARLEALLWPDGSVCPHCGALDRICALNGVRSKKTTKHPEGVIRHGLRKCGHCLKQFTVRVGTIFEDSHAPLHKWFQAIHLLCASKKGISAHQLHRMLEVQYKTAWFMAHRIREAMRDGPLSPMGSGGIVEIDETIYGRAATHPKGRGPFGSKLSNSAHKNVDPTRLAGPKLKVERAKCHIQDFEALAQAFAAQNNYSLVREEDPQTRENVIRLLVKERLPIKMSAIIGDIVHNLRAALDHLVSDLIRANEGEPDGDSGFPIVTRRKSLKPGSISKIEGVSPRAERFILRLKPYEAGNSNPLLYKLHRLDVEDKHAGIIPVAAATTQVTAQVAMPFMAISETGEMNLMLGGLPPGFKPVMTAAGVPKQFRPVLAVTDNVEIYRSAPGLNEDIQCSVGIAFGQGKVCEGEPVIETLKQFADLVERVIAICERKLI